MKTIFYSKFFSRLFIALVVSFLISRFSMLGNNAFDFALTFFAALYLLLAWFSYLGLDGVHFFRKKDSNSDLKVVKITIFAYLACSVILFIVSQILFIA